MGCSSSEDPRGKGGGWIRAAAGGGGAEVAGCGGGWKRGKGAQAGNAGSLVGWRWWVQLEGSLLVQARDPLGETVDTEDGHPRLRYGQK